MAITTSTTTERTELRVMTRVLWSFVAASSCDALEPGSIVLEDGVDPTVVVERRLWSAVEDKTVIVGGTGVAVTVTMSETRKVGKGRETIVVKVPGAAEAEAVVVVSLSDGKSGVVSDPPEVAVGRVWSMDDVAMPVTAGSESITVTVVTTGSTGRVEGGDMVAKGFGGPAGSGGPAGRGRDPEKSGGRRGGAMGPGPPGESTSAFSFPMSTVSGFFMEDRAQYNSRWHEPSPRPAGPTGEGSGSEDGREKTTRACSGDATAKVGLSNAIVMATK